MESETFPDDLLCSLFVREDPGVPIEEYRVKTVESSYVNLDTQRVDGWDIEASYAVDFANGMGLSFVTSHTIMETKETESTSGVITSRLGRAGNPKWVGNLTSRLTKGDWAATWRINYVDGTDNNRPGLATSDTWTGSSGEQETYYYSRTLDSRMYHNLSFNYRFGAGWAANLGVINVTDELPPRASQGGGLRVEGYGAFHSQYDWKGRRYTLNIKKEF
jgi:iron complex outermembrane receptor protein